VWRKATKRFEKATGILSFTHHAMRSTLATFFKSHGFNDIIATKSLGHGNSQITHDFYLRPLSWSFQRLRGCWISWL